MNLHDDPENTSSWEIMPLKDSIKRNIQNAITNKSDKMWATVGVSDDFEKAVEYADFLRSIIMMEKIKGQIQTVMDLNYNGLERFLDGID